ncbi:MAG TPA: HAD-IIIA family hydrolase [Xanthobacteraceae bacterium]|nr:HAD-IIIA family hydrolase [Xanthobacteraceae bacterium]
MIPGPLVDGIGLWCDPHGRFDGSPALFVDRDGVIVEETHYLGHADDVRLIPGAASAIATCNDACIPVVVVTNQSGIARGHYDWDGFQAVQGVIAAGLAAEGAHVDAVLACAYHRDGQAAFCVADHPWRKPRPGMILEAAQRMGVDLAGSWIIGDRADDLAAGAAAGLVGGTLVMTGYGSRAAERTTARALARHGFAVETAPALAQAVAAAVARMNGAARPR